MATSLQDRLESRALDPLCLALRFNLNLWKLDSYNSIRFNQIICIYIYIHICIISQYSSDTPIIFSWFPVFLICLTWGHAMASSRVCQDPRSTAGSSRRWAFCPEEIDGKMLLREGFPSTQLQCGDLAPRRWVLRAGHRWLFRRCHFSARLRKYLWSRVGPLGISVCGTWVRVERTHLVKFAILKMMTCRILSDHRSSQVALKKGEVHQN